MTKPSIFVKFHLPNSTPEWLDISTIKSLSSHAGAAAHARTRVMTGVITRDVEHSVAEVQKLMIDAYTQAAAQEITHVLFYDPDLVIATKAAAETTVGVQQVSVSGDVQLDADFDSKPATSGAFDYFRHLSLPEIKALASIDFRVEGQRVVDGWFMLVFDGWNGGIPLGARRERMYTAMVDAGNYLEALGNADLNE